jgi:sporulation protein YhbH
MSDVNLRFSLSNDDWSLHRKSERDKARHLDKIKDIIKNNLDNIISQENIITSNKGKIVKIPIRGLQLPHFTFDPHDPNKKRVGSGQGGTKKGDILGKVPTSKGNGKGKEAGEEPGQEYYEVAISMEELAELIYEDLELPNLKDKGSDNLKKVDHEFNTRTKKGILSNLDRKQTIFNAMKRQASDKAIYGTDNTKLIIKEEDKIYKNWEDVVKPKRNAVVFAVRDVSGSMGEWESYICKAFFYWMNQFLHTKYDGVEIVFITCHTKADEVTEEEFFTRGGSGGTKMASAYELQLELIDKKYNHREWNIYSVLFTDGYNWGDSACVDLVKQLLKYCNCIGYGETDNGAWSHSDQYAALGQALHSAFNQDDKFRIFKITDKSEVWKALKTFFSLKNKTDI